MREVKMTIRKPTPEKYLTSAIKTIKELHQYVMQPLCFDNMKLRSTIQDDYGDIAPRLLMIVLNGLRSVFPSFDFLGVGLLVGILPFLDFLSTLFLWMLLPIYLIYAIEIQFFVASFYVAATNI